MYQVGDVVVFGTDGVFRVNEITAKKIGKVTADYYVLRSVYRASTVMYVPVGQGGLEDRMHPVLSRQAMEELIDHMPEYTCPWIQNENERKARYKEILGAGDRSAVAGMIKTLSEHRCAQEEAGKKMHLSDERFLKDAERLLYDEIAQVLELHPSEVVSYLSSKLV